MMPFVAIGATGADDADDFGSFVFKLEGVGNQQYHAPADHAKGLPSLFSMLDAILYRKGQRVIEHARGVFESNAMLAEIEICFVVVPFEVALHGKRVAYFCIYKKGERNAHEGNARGCPARSARSLPL